MRRIGQWTKEEDAVLLELRDSFPAGRARNEGLSKALTERLGVSRSDKAVEARLKNLHYASVSEDAHFRFLCGKLKEKWHG